MVQKAASSLHDKHMSQASFGFLLLNVKAMYCTAYRKPLCDTYIHSCELPNAKFRGHNEVPLCKFVYMRQLF